MLLIQQLYCCTKVVHRTVLRRAKSTSKVHTKDEIRSRCSPARFRRSPPPGWSYLVPYSSLLSSQALDWPCSRVADSGVWDLAHPRTCGVRTWVRALDADGHCASARTCRDLSLEDSVARAKRYTRLTDDQVRFGARRAIRPAFCSASAKAPR